MMQEIDQQGGFDAALFIGYHARAGTRNAVLDHTYADRIHEVRLNGKPVGELGLNAGLAGVHGVPVALVSGDSALAAEAKDLLGDGVATVIVKQAVSRHAAKSVAPAVACRMIREEVRRAAWFAGSANSTARATPCFRAASSEPATTARA